MLRVITVWYNEESNLKKLYKSLESFSGDIDFLYVDQESTDDSLKVAQSFWAQCFSHTNKWYADPDKKWLLENHCNKDDWVLIADADFFFSDACKAEILEFTQKSEFDIGELYIHVYFLGIVGLKTKQPLLFKKWAISLSEDIHNYTSKNTQHMSQLIEPIISDDIKEHGKTISTWLQRIDRYTSVEVVQMQKIGKYKLIILLLTSPWIWFFWYGIKHLQFLKWIRGFLNCGIQFVYRFSLYAKLYEKYYVKIWKNDS